MNPDNQAVFRLLGRHGVGLYAVGMISSLVLSMTEYVIAFFLVAFLFSLGFTTEAHLPAWWPIQVQTFSSLGTWALLLAVGVLRAAAQVASYHSKMMLTERTNARFKMLLGYIILKQEHLYAMPLSRINFYMSECFPKATSFVFYLAQMTSFCVQAMVMIACMVGLAWGESLIGLLGLGIMGGLVLYTNRFTNRIASRVPEAGQSLETTKLRVTRNWILIKVLRMQDVEHERLLNAIHRYYRDSVLAYLFGNLGGALMPVLGIVIIAAMVVAHFRLFDTSATNFVAFLYLFVRLEQRLANGSNLMGGLFTFHPQFRESLRLFRALSPQELDDAFQSERHVSLWRMDATPPAPSAHVFRAAPQQPEPAAPPHVRTENISFYWPESDEPVIEDLSLDIPSGSQFGIIGPNGSGKSTLLGIILGIYSPTQGRVLINEADCASYYAQNAASIAYVGPEPYLIQGSILENLTYGMPEQPQEDTVRQALRTVRLDTFVDSLPQGIDSMIREDGSGLSSGQKQRLTIARAFLRDPRLLVLDEPSANLDEATEEAVVNTLKALKGRCTVIIVSHRPGILRDVDHTLELKKPGYATARLSVGKSDGAPQ
jgi:ABC-type multidrug transport system fused ATPase/permease subunit